MGVVTESTLSDFLICMHILLHALILLDSFEHFATGRS